MAVDKELLVKGGRFLRSFMYFQSVSRPPGAERAPPPRLGPFSRQARHPVMCNVAVKHKPWLQTTLLLFCQRLEISFIFFSFTFFFYSPQYIVNFDPSIWAFRR